MTLTVDPKFSVLQQTRHRLRFLLQVPSKKNVKVRFNMFFVLEPGIPVSSCTKDYVQINSTRWVLGAL